MGQVQRGTRKKLSGGMFKWGKSKRLSEKAREPISTKIGESMIKSVRTPGNNRKYKVMVAQTVNVCDPKKKKCIKAKIKTVVDNPANRHFIKRNIITKGAIVETDIGKVKITSRPGQSGTLNGVLV